ncbi:hypothetical protein PICSAR238_04132 [Mycobacterium avium subsp. paratuberculosis]|nr:hypothetical protein PICSAR238_04132 [Mycobacterium avium subsp. paratuberculosis]
MGGASHVSATSAAACTALPSSETAGLTAEVNVAHCWGTDNAPTRPAPAEVALTWLAPPTLPRLPNPSLANCGVGYHAPPAPAVLPPGPDTSCWASCDQNAVMPFEK